MVPYYFSYLAFVSRPIGKKIFNGVVGTVFGCPHVSNEIKITCRQISLFIPYNYKEISFPVALFTFMVQFFLHFYVILYAA
jgi:hypothetical protein